MAARDDLLAAWLQLTRETLPGMAAAQRWPIRLDHCFMRVCLDDALGVRWDTVVRRPAVRHLTEAQLARAVATARRIAGDPASLTGLNDASLRDARQGPCRGDDGSDGEILRPRVEHHDGAGALFGCSCHSSLISTPMRSAPSSLSSGTWSSSFGQAG